VGLEKSFFDFPLKRFLPVDKHPRGTSARIDRKVTFPFFILSLLTSDLMLLNNTKKTIFLSYIFIEKKIN